MAALNHPHICTLYDVGANYLVMEFVDGESLAARLKKGGLSVEDTLRYGGQIADVLAAAHLKGIIHRDLKPGDSMLPKSGVKLLDFGLAKSHGEETLTSRTRYWALRRTGRRNKGKAQNVTRDRTFTLLVWYCRRWRQENDCKQRVRRMANAEVVCVDGVDAVEAVVIRRSRTRHLYAVNASAFLSSDGSTWPAHSTRPTSCKPAGTSLVTV